MFGNNHKKNGKVDKDLRDTNSSINLIGKGTEIKGEIHADGDIRIDGTLKGNITSKSKIVIGKTGKIEGDITCENADVLGKVVGGKLQIRKLLSLKSTADIAAEISTKKLVVEPGAEFNGNCRMAETEQQDDNEQKKARSKQKVKEKK